MEQTLLDRVFASPRLPSLPTIALEVIDLVQKPDVDIRQIAETIQLDPALTGKILKIVNSSFYGQTYAVGTISHALVVLGLNAVKTLALGFSLVANLQRADAGDFDHVTYWKRSIYAGTAAKSLAKQLGLVQQEEAFLGGLLEDLGMLAMNQTIRDSYRRVVAAAGNDHHALATVEQRELGADHAEVGARLADQWMLPPLLVQAIRCHEQPDNASEDTQPLVRCVALGNLIAQVFTADHAGGAMQRCQRAAQAWFGMDPETLEPLLKAIHKQTNEMRRLFELPTGELGSADEILARANEALQEITLRTQQQSTVLQQQNRELVQQATTDSLTGAANRRQFNEFIADAFARAMTDGQPLSVLFLDADHFKHLNDTYGHPSGDRVLVELASIMRAHTPESALVARYGGEEFAVVIPGADRRTAAQLAESIRRAIESAQVRSDEGQPLPVTVSIGVATAADGCFERVEQLVKAADQGVYAAKAGGRNCVRIFAARRIKPAA